MAVDEHLLKWTTQKRVISELLPHPSNPRQMTEKQVEQLKASLERFDLVEIPAINTDNTILAGHQRLKIMQMLGRGSETIDVRVPTRELTKEEADEYLIRSNKNTGEWDFDILANEWEFTDLEEWGFDLDDLKIHLDHEVEEDETPAVSDEPPKSKLGEVYSLGRHRVMCGDSTKIEDVEKLMDGKKADMVFTDPPYGVSYQSNMRTKTEKFDVIKNDDVIDGRAIELAYEYSTGWVLVCTGWTVLTEWLSIIDDKITNLIVWDKGGGGMGDLKHSLLTDYELIMAYNRGNEIVGKRLGSVWSIGKDFAGSYAHPTQKPVELPAQAIKTFSTGSVLDLFLGSGSTLIACEQTDRTCYGMELDPKYVDVIRKRYAKFIGKEDEWLTITPKL